MLKFAEPVAKLTYSQTYVNDTVQCLEEIRCQYQDTDNVILFGHGVGGLLAALIAAQLPDIVKGLVLHAPIFKVLPDICIQQVTF